MFIDTITVSRYKLINLLTAQKKNEKIKIKNPILCMLVFIIACVMLGWAYWKVSAKATTISTIQEMIKPIIAGNNRNSTSVLVIIRIHFKISTIKQKRYI